MLFPDSVGSTKGNPHEVAPTCSIGHRITPWHLRLGHYLDHPSRHYHQHREIGSAGGVLLPPFERDSGYRVHVIAVGTGKALRLTREGDVYVVLVHARADEDKLIADGYGVHRRDVMYNDFVVIGPKSDPAGIRGLEDAVAALSKIETTASLFVSRGDESGTHKKEQALWQQAKITPAGPWYREVGQGMGKILLMAGELDAYTLTDHGTWLAYRDRSPLEVLAEGDER